MASTPKETAQMSQSLRNVTDQSFETDVLKSPLPVLVDYSAEWCGPCRMVSPIVEESAMQYAGQLTVAKLDIDASPRTPARYNVRGIPTLMLFKGGQPVATHVGSLSKGQLKAFIEKHILLSATEVAAATR
jgi:thioredoxin 1